MTDEVRCAVTDSGNTALEAETVQGLAEEEADVSEELAAQALREHPVFEILSVTIEAARRKPDQKQT